MPTTELTSQGAPARPPQTSGTAGGLGPSIYYLHPLLAGPLDAWPGHLDRAALLGFDHVLIAPPFQAGDTGSLLLTADLDRLDSRLGWTGDALSGLAQLAAWCLERGLTPLLDVVTDRIAAGSALAARTSSLYQAGGGGVLDPRHAADEHVAVAMAESSDALEAWWAGRLVEWAGAGIAGFRLVAPATAGGPRFVRDLVGGVRTQSPGAVFLGWMPGIAQTDLAGFAGTGLDFVFSSFPWWDFRGEWFWHEAAALQRIGRTIAAPEAPFGPRLTASCHDPLLLRVSCERAIAFAAATGAGWMLPMGCEAATGRRLDPARDTPDDFAQLLAEAPFDLSDAIMAANRLRHDDPVRDGEKRLLTAPGAPVLALLRVDAPDARFARQATLVLANADIAHRRSVATDLLLGNAGGAFVPVLPGITLELAPGEVRTEFASAAAPILRPDSDLVTTARAAAMTPRIAIEAVTPSVDEGRFPARRVIGDLVQVEADIICEGHDVLGVALFWRPVGAGHWNEMRMHPLGNDRFAGSFPLLQIGLYEFTVEAWHDAFGTFRSELSKKHAAGVDVTLELEEGRLLVARTAAGSSHAAALDALAGKLAAATHEERLTTLLSEEVADLMMRADPRPFAVRIVPAFPLESERSTARFASWYEIFPRSTSDDVNRHGTFDDVIRHLPRIRDMGFDILYFPPIHPIGRTNRKGRNNTLTPGPTDPGSPYAIGSDEGGHTDVHPELGTLDDFRRLVGAARAHGLEIALDFAIQCAPDHPWLKQHKGWFDWRPDGSIKYAENPPKKYQDIVNVDFYAPDAVPDLWVELCRVVLFWVSQGVTVFRVDNPHTKPLPFWRWMIGEVKARHPDTMFLAEAFTKPKMMYRLAKIGFSQSYTYFTWRDTRADLTAYLQELTTTAPKEFFRPNFFVNTPDINPIFVQTSGRAGFLIRAALATTLAGLWGLYSGFELCEATPLPGREEYADAEKYEIKAWDWNRPGNIVAEVTALNWIRRTNPALQTHLGVTFLDGWNSSVITYEKATRDRSNVVLVAVNLDPWRVQETDIEVPLWSWSLPDHAALEAEDLLTGTRARWQGKTRHIRLDPASSPYAIWRLSPAA